MPQTLFIFIDDINLTLPFSSIVLNEKGKILQGLEKRDLETLRQLGDNTHTTLVLPANIAKPHIVSLPTLKKSDLTVPNLLEEDLIQDQDALHFVLVKEPHVETHYLVNVIEKTLLSDLLLKLNELQLDIDTLTSDFIFQQEKTRSLTPNYALINELTNAAVLPPHLFHLLPSQSDEEVTTLVFSDTHPSFQKALTNTTKIVSVDSTYHEYLAQQFISTPPSNLLQGKFEQKKHDFKRLPLFSYALISLALIFFIFTHVTQYVMTQHRLDTLKTKVKNTYHVFFPDSQSMVSPRFRIQQLLKDQNASTESQTFFSLLSRLNTSLASHSQIQVNDLVYQNDQMEIELKADNFGSLKRFRATLKANQLTIKQLTAKTDKKWVSARWRLSR
jgi:general secretion pathway protein L